MMGFFFILRGRLKATEPDYGSRNWYYVVLRALLHKKRGSGGSLLQFLMAHIFFLLIWIWSILWIQSILNVLLNLECNIAVDFCFICCFCWFWLVGVCCCFCNCNYCILFIIPKQQFDIDLYFYSGRRKDVLLIVLSPSF